MAEFNRVIDYIIEQADRYDIKNLQFEEDIKYELSRMTDRYYSMILNKVMVDITSVLAMQKLMISITDVMNRYINVCERIMLDTFEEYYNTAYNNTGDLIDLGNEIMAKYSQVSEQRVNREYDEETIGYIQDHAFELLKGHSYQKVEKIRAELGDLFLSGRANKTNVRSAIQKILDVNRSKAEEIAQTELSRAYNYGVLHRFGDYQRLTGQNVRKYWHGFKYSENTCEYCRPRIGNIYDLDESDEELPAHVRCRCVWLPILEGWDKPVNTKLISRANMLNTAYNKDMIYLRINNRLGINYAEYMSDNAIEDYISGDRTEKIYNEMDKARDRYVKDKVSSFDIAKDNSRTHMSTEFNQQMDFWKKFVANAMADNDKEILDKSYEAIKGVMILPWNAEQLDKWNTLLGIISNFK
jgi:SPP1 gp7 family putative phage head morphogenesis protein